jgi:hypothetical protein
MEFNIQINKVWTNIYFFLINVGLSASLCVSRLISRVLKLTTIQVFIDHGIYKI